MKQLAKEIAAYTNHLKSQYGLGISFHMKSEFSDRFSPYSEILPYNSHLNSYCTVVKKNNFDKCIKCQRLVMKKCERVRSFTGECHAGVDQYIHAIENKDGVMGFISVSGYAGKKRAPHGDILYAGSMRHGEIPEKFLNTVIAPLARMLGILMNEKAKTPDDGFGKIKAFADEYHTALTLEMICKNLHFSKSYVSHVFKANTGYTLKGYCNKLKINDAKNLLKTTSLSVTEIALAVGFDNISYFISTFKKQTGATPLEYRKRH